MMPVDVVSLYWLPTIRTGFLSLKVCTLQKVMVQLGGKEILVVNLSVLMY